MKDAQGSAAIEGGVFIEFRPPEPEQCQFLDDFLERVLPVLDRLRAVTFDEDLQCLINAVGEIEV